MGSSHKIFSVGHSLCLHFSVKCKDNSDVLVRNSKSLLVDTQHESSRSIRAVLICHRISAYSIVCYYCSVSFVELECRRTNYRLDTTSLPFQILL